MSLLVWMGLSMACMQLFRVVLICQCTRCLTDLLATQVTIVCGSAAILTSSMLVFPGRTYGTLWGKKDDARGR
jgi:hypothetical protein